jgi:hypothetical protein
VVAGGHDLETQLIQISNRNPKKSPVLEQTKKYIDTNEDEEEQQMLPAIQIDEVGTQKTPK